MQGLFFTSILGVVLVLSGASVLLIEMDNHDQRFCLIAYVLQYVGVVLLFVRIFSIQIILSVFLLGLMGAAILGTDQVNLRDRIAIRPIFTSARIFRFLTSVIIAILIFGIIIIMHELGHFLIAKKNGIQVDEFCIGLGPTIIGKQVGETFYSVKLLPFGGACMMGEDEDRPEENAFNNKSVWARMAVIFGGPFFNFILAFIFSIIVIGMSGADIPKISKVEKDSPAYEAGIRKGDTMIKVAGKKMHNYREFSYYMYLDYDGGKIPITILQNGKEKNINVTPEYDKERGQYLIGITWNGYQKVGPLKTIEYSFREVGLQVKITLKSVKMLVSQKLGVKDLSGPVGIVKTVGDQYTQAAAYGFKTVFLTMVNWIILISANLGVMNLLPLPALDGGRLLFLIIEAITGKAVSQNMEALVHTAGLILLMLLMVFVMYQDIVKIFM